jgi:geranylgeranyl diphosphate synthase, type I
MTLQQQSEMMLPVLEKELQQQIQRLDDPSTHLFHDMLAYHMGWSTDNTLAVSAGKRIRPLLMLLVVSACGGEWLRATPAAAAIELLHNFSLIHDDIEDNSPMRRGRVTVWKKFGLPMAVNAGDALFAISDLSALDIDPASPAETVLRAARVLHLACLSLTRGQYLDLSYEKRMDLAVDDYWPMVDGKTAALLAACGEMGGILGGATSAIAGNYAAFGRNLGLAFQVQDDILGVWGDEYVTGKSAASDLVEGKNSLPVLYGIGGGGAFSRRWAAAPIRAEEAKTVAQMLKDEGAYEYCTQEAQRLTNVALEELRAASPTGAAGEALEELAHAMLNRQA